MPEVRGVDSRMVSKAAFLGATTLEKERAGKEELLPAGAITELDPAFNPFGTNESHFQSAIGYANEVMTKADTVTWEHIIELHRMILGEEADTRLLKQRTASAEATWDGKLGLIYSDFDFQGSLPDLLSKTFTNREDVIRAAQVIYSEITTVCPAYMGPFLCLQGFRSNKGLEGQQSTGLLLMNTFLIRNGYNPFAMKFSVTSPGRYPLPQVIDGELKTGLRINNGVLGFKPEELV